MNEIALERIAALARDALGPDSRGWGAAELTALLAQPGGLLVETDPPGEGFALLRCVADEAELLLIATAAPRRRQGLGAALLARAEAAARDSSVRRMILEVAADNQAARALYARAGYGVVGRRPRYYARPGAAPVDALILARDL